MHKILITGGAGFIGAHVAQALKKAGHNVVLLDAFDDYVYSADFKRKRLQAMFPHQEDHPRLIEGNILDVPFLESVFEGEHFDTVLHFAALANPGKSMEAVTEYAQVNIQGTINILEACRAHNVKQLIFAGSSSLYDDGITPFREDSYPWRPRSPYGASKAAAEIYIRMWHDLYGIPTTILRFFSVYGPWGRPDMAPNVFTEKILRGEQLEVTKDRQRDFTYIDDIVAGILLAVEKRLDFETMNLGRGEPHELMEFIRAIEKASGKTAQVIMRDAPPGEMKETFADTTRAHEELGYVPSVSLEAGVQQLVEWMKQELSL